MVLSSHHTAGCILAQGAGGNRAHFPPSAVASFRLQVQFLACGILSHCLVDGSWHALRKGPLTLSSPAYTLSPGRQVSCFLSNGPAILKLNTGLCPEFAHHGLHLTYLKQHPASMLCCNLGSILQGLPAGTGLPRHSLTLQPARLCCHGGCSLSALLSVQREFTCFPATLQQPRSTCAPGTQAKQTQGWCSGAGSVFCFLSRTGVSDLPHRISQGCLGCWQSGEPGRVFGLFSSLKGRTLDFHKIPSSG